VHAAESMWMIVSHPGEPGSWVVVSICPSVSKALIW
jgi:hypothetical protein